MKRRLTPEQRWWRVGLITWGMALFLWLPFEDTQPWAVILFGACASALLALRWIISGNARRLMAMLAPPGASRVPLVLFHIGLGLLAGLAVSPLSMALMVFKNGVHAHPTPDFSIAHVLFVVNRTLVWGAGGLAAGLVAGLWAWRKR